MRFLHTKLSAVNYYSIANILNYFYFHKDLTIILVIIERGCQMPCPVSPY